MQGTRIRNHIPVCASAKTPAQILIYRPKPGFTGADRVSFGVVDSVTPNEHVHSLVVTVRP